MKPKELNLFQCSKRVEFIIQTNVGLSISNSCFCFPNRKFPLFYLKNIINFFSFRMVYLFKIVCRSQNDIKRKRLQNHFENLQFFYKLSGGSADYPFCQMYKFQHTKLFAMVRKYINSLIRLKTGNIYQNCFHLFRNAKAIRIQNSKKNLNTEIP